MDDVELSRKLREDEDLVSTLEQCNQQPIQETHLARGVDDSLIDRQLVVDVPWIVEQMRGVANKSKLHLGVAKVLPLDVFRYTRLARCRLLDTKRGIRLTGHGSSLILLSWDTLEC